jgi:hypothetical protein
MKIIRNLSWALALAWLPIVTASVQAGTVAIASTNDGFLDQHVNYNSDAMGVAAFGHSHAPAPASNHILVGRRADDYGSPDTGPSMFGVIKFDVSSLAGQTITGATLRLVQTIDETGVPNRTGAQFAATTDIYGVDSGDYDENTSSWLNYIGGSGNPVMATFLSNFVTYLGTMNNVSSPGGLAGPGGVSTFTDVDLTALVQDWVNNSSSNLGIVLANPASASGPPAAPGDILARYAAHESTSFDGPQLIIEFVPEPSAILTMVIGAFLALSGLRSRA